MLVTDRAEVIREVCEIVALAYHSVGDYSHASDCFCDNKSGVSGFRNEMQSVDFVRQAVLEKLVRDGIKVHRDFDAITGRPI